MNSTNENTSLNNIYVEEYVKALNDHYPEAMWTREAKKLLEVRPFDYGVEDRYQKPTERLNDGITGWITHLAGARNAYTIARVYKGMLCGKSPIDLWLYSACLWETRPRTVIEFGSMHGGSALWLADQVSAMALDCHVHSYELFSKAVSHRAQHQQLSFHYADLHDLETIDRQLFRALPHPWLVIDDAHTNVLNVLSFCRESMQMGDYFVKEDTDGLGTAAEQAEYLSLAQTLGFFVDRIYADAFGFNVTTARNCWFTLRSNATSHQHRSGMYRDLTWESTT